MKAGLKIVGIGNSIVNGFPLKRSQCFLSIIRRDTGHEVINKGVNGDTTEGIRRRLARDMLFHCPDVGLILTGTNDFIRDMASPGEAFANLVWIAEKMEGEGIRPLLLTPVPVEPDLAAQRWMPGAAVDYREINRKLEELSAWMLEKLPEKTLDLGGAFQRAMDGQAPEDWTVDGVHPTAAGHRILADAIMGWLEENGLLRD